jgi:hypothetical protein
VTGAERPRRWRLLPAGVLLVVLGVAPVALSAAGTSDGLGSLAVACVPPLLVGVFYLRAEFANRRAPAIAVPAR